MKLRDYQPLIFWLVTIALLVSVKKWFFNSSIQEAMLDSMGLFFLIFGSLKIVNLNNFVQSFGQYDILARYSRMYAYAYPFIEMALGLAYLFRYRLFATNLITLVIMPIAAFGVARELLKGRQLNCACLGTVFTVPLSWMTVLEDLVMAAMALGLLVS